MAPEKRGRNWSEEDLQNAMKAVNRGRGISVREASRRFSVPRRTLRNHINTKSTKKRMGRAYPSCRLVSSKKLINME